jgi:ABC-2 type transport system permease protein
MTTNRTLATSSRVLRQLSHDHRTLGLLFVVPVVLLGLLKWIYGDTPKIFDMIGPSLLGIFPFVMMFLTTSIATLRERTTGTLERLLAMPIRKLDIIVGYALSFGLLAMVQAVIASLFATRVYGLDIAGPEWFLIVIAVVDAILGATLGLLASAFARTEFQAAQFMPAFVLPQLLLCGLLVPVAQLPSILEKIANVLPMTYAVDAMQRISHETTITGRMGRDISVILGFAIVAILLGAVTLRRKTR